MGLKFDQGQNLLKHSLDLMILKSSFDFNSKNISTDTALLELSSSYIFPVNHQIKLGPKIGLLYSPMGSSFSNSHSDGRKTSVLIGIDSSYKLNNHFDLGFNVSNQFESRINILGNLGLEYNF